MQKYKVAVTGGIGSGKTSALNFIKNLGYFTLSADEIAREVFDRPDVTDKLKEIFPNALKDGVLDRKLLAKIVFSNPEKLEILNSITHPLIIEEMFKRIEESPDRIIVAEVPLLFEGSYESLFDDVIVLLRGEDARKRDINSRDGLCAEEIEKRIKNQFDYAKLDKTAHNIIYNYSSLEELYQKIKAVMEKIEKVIRK